MTVWRKDLRFIIDTVLTADPTITDQKNVYAGRSLTVYAGRRGNGMQNKNAAAPDRVIKTTVELPSPLADKVMITVYKKKMQDRKYTMKQFITDAIIAALAAEGGEK